MTNKIGVAITDSGGTFQLATCHPADFYLDATAFVRVNYGGTTPKSDYGAFYDTTTQPLVSTTVPQVVAIGHTSYNNNVSISGGNQMVFANAGTFNIQISIQLTNNNTQPKDVVLWFRKSGTDIPISASTVTVDGTHGGTKGHYVLALNIIEQFTAGQYIQVYWVGTSTDLSVETLPASAVPPVYPVSPSVILTATKVL